MITSPAAPKDKGEPLAPPVKLPGPEPSSLVEQGNRFFKAGNYEKAAEAYQQAIRLKPRDAGAYFALGNAYGQLDRWQKAADAFQQAIRLKPDYAEAHSNLEVAYRKLGRSQESVPTSQKATTNTSIKSGKASEVPSPKTFENIPQSLVIPKEFKPIQKYNKLDKPLELKETTKRQQPEKEIKIDYFTIGSSKDDVLAVQGTPSNISFNTWHYGYSSITFVNDKVSNYNNFSNNLKIRMASKSSNLNHFTIGSSKDDVLAVQGTPSNISFNTWHYGYSSITFVNDKVSSYNNFSNNLKIRMASKSSNLNYFTIGSSKDDVLAVQGTPSNISFNTWHYGYSSITFVNDKVSSYNNFSNNLKIRMAHK